MRKCLLVILTAIAILVSVFAVSCDNNVKRYSVTFDYGYEIDNKIEYVKEGDRVNKPPDPERADYTFVEWQRDGKTYDFDSLITEDIILIAKWDSKVFYTVIIDYYEYDVDPEKISVKSGNTVSRPDDPDPKEYDWGYFSGWYLYDEENYTWADEEYDFSTPVTSDIYLLAVWEYNKYTVTFNTDGGEPASYPNQIVYYEWSIRDPGTPTKEGYNFLGWYNGEEKIDSRTEITQNYDLIAKWEPKVYYNVTFDSDGGTTVSSQKVEKGKTATKPSDPVKDDYYFHAWVYKNDESHIFDFEKDTVTEDIELKAVWKSPYTIGQNGPAGGYIFYDAGSVQKSTYKDSSGNDVTYYWRYLEAAPEDITIDVDGTTLSKFIFGYYYNTRQFGMVGAGSQEIGSGRLNTSLLVNAMKSEAYENSNTSSFKTDKYAAKVCDDYSLTSTDGISYDDWFLPSLNELYEIYEKLYKASTSIGNFKAEWYWSSSESVVVSYVIQFQSEGNFTTPSRSNIYNVRPIRAL